MESRLLLSESVTHDSLFSFEEVVALGGIDRVLLILLNGSIFRFKHEMVEEALHLVLDHLLILLSGGCHRYAPVGRVPFGAPAALLTP